MLLLYLFFCLFLSLTYTLLMLRYYFDWQALPYYEPTHNGQAPQTKVSVLVPARNEAANIERCITSLLQQDFYKSLYEIIIIDDHSDDDTAALAEAFADIRVRVLRLADYPELPQQAFKKLALSTAIKEAKGELIVTTDADCYMGTSWLSTLVSYYENHSVKMITAPVCMVDESTLLEIFQSLDFCGMMGITGAGVSKGYMLMGNGANIAYPKKIFQEVDGFKGINHLASGDDMLLMQKIAAVYPGEVHFLKNTAAVVFTKAQPTWSDFIQQRIRWASKSSAYPQKGVTAQLAGVYLFCCSLIVNVLLIPFWKLAWVVVAGQLFIKIVVDYTLLNTMTIFFRRSDLMKSFLPAQLLHLGYIVGIGTLGNVVKQYRWKGRRVR